jgi:hypothetical protein
MRKGFRIDLQLLFRNLLARCPQLVRVLAYEVA